MFETYDGFLDFLREAIDSSPVGKLCCEKLFVSREESTSSLVEHIPDAQNIVIDTDLLESCSSIAWKIPSGRSIMWSRLSLALFVGRWGVESEKPGNESDSDDKFLI